jgi:hypothetical protein
MVKPSPKRRTELAAPVLTLALAIGVGCSGPTHNTSTSSTSSPNLTAPAVAHASAVPASSASAEVDVPPAVPRVKRDRAQKVLFPTGAPEGLSCAAKEDDPFIRCLVEARFASHEAEKKDALALFDELGDVVGVEEEQDMDGGFRGRIHLVPELPVGQYKKHLGWILGAQRDVATFVRAIEAKATKPLAYRHKALAWKFMRSVGRTTPSAYAGAWEVGYNVSGSLHANADAVRETVFHEVFHLNDQEHGNWSRSALGPIVDAIASKCGAKTACLTPYAPFKTMVRGGTYYAFQPNNGDIAHEYSAELATRYFREQLAASRGATYPGGWFKCGPAENAKTMKALADEFFGGVDLTPACP